VEDKIAVISDVHGNYDALEAVLKRIDKFEINKIFCLGDIIGYGAQPNRCYQKLKERDCIIIKGNHEDILLEKIGDQGCSKIGKQSNRWTKDNIDINIKGELQYLPFSAQYKGISMYHSSMIDDGKYPYLNDANSIIDAFSSKKGIVFYGHTHRPRVTFKVDNTIYDEYILETKEFFIKPGYSCYVNVGSVGQQRDNRTDASFAICMIGRNGITIKLFRIAYKSFSAYRKVVRYGSGIEVASYFIRENWRRRAYELLNNRCIRVRGRISKKTNGSTR
jgi:predicted phosphodiesterase